MGDDAMAGRPPAASECKAEFRRILDSETFRHSDGLRRLLEYLGGKALNGASVDLKEYTIGIEAFGKPADYDPQQDPAVRVLASKLRHRLEDYYLKEGAADPVRIDLPKGHYSLKFSARSDEAAAERSALIGQVRRWRWLSLGLGVSALVLGVALLLSRTSPPPVERAELAASWTPELELIWKPYLESRRPVLVALGTPLFTKLAGSFFRSPRINDWETAESSPQIPLLQRALGSPYALPWNSFTGVGEATGAFLLAKLLHGRKPNLMLKRSVALSWDDIRQHNVIFLGSPKFNPQLKDFPSKGDFVIEGGVIRNLRPMPGEQKEYRDVWKTQVELVEDYALIYRFPGLHGRGEVMVLASSSTEGTWAAVEYVTGFNHARDLVHRLRLPSGDLPKSYQIVIKAKFQDDVPVEISHVTHRVLDRLPAAVPSGSPKQDVK
jgi:hypothetical protein